MNFMRKYWIAVLLTSALLAPPASAQSAKAGVEALQRGDAARAVAIWKPLAERGDPDSAFNLGQAYRLGRGVPLNLGEAQKWFEVAARKGHVDAQTTLGLLLFSSGNRPAAMRWLKSASDAGEPRAMLMYGTALYNGDGVPEDPVRGYAYVSRAAAMGLGPAQSTLADMNQVMPAEQRQQGLTLARTMTSGGKAVAAKPAPAKPALTTKPPQIAAPTRPPVKPSSPPSPASGAGGWRIQLGAFSQRSSAEALFAKVRGKLGGRQAYYVPVGAVIRLQAGPYPSKDAAAAACAVVKPAACFPVPGR